MKKLTVDLIQWGIIIILFILSIIISIKLNPTDL